MANKYVTTNVMIEQKPDLWVMYILSGDQTGQLIGSAIGKTSAECQANANTIIAALNTREEQIHVAS